MSSDPFILSQWFVNSLSAINAEDIGVDGSPERHRKDKIEVPICLSVIFRRTRLRAFECRSPETSYTLSEPR